MNLKNSELMPTTTIFATISGRQILLLIFSQRSRRHTRAGNLYSIKWWGGVDVIMAFFPCTRFEAKVPLSFRGEAPQQKNWNDLKKLQYSMKLHGELHELYEKLCELTVVAERKGLRMVIENPFTQPHYLTTYWCIKPSVIDKDRTNDGDYYKKPTQYFFIGFEPSFNIVMEPLDVVKTRTIAGCRATETTSRQVERSMMHPQYARRFIKKYILPNESKG